MDLKTLFKIEYIKLFRRSNVLFLFLFIYMCIPGTWSFESRGFAAGLNFFEQTVLYVSVFFGILLMSIFILNNTGNDFNENSYRKNLADGMTKQDYSKGKFLLIIFFTIFVITFTLFVYFLFGSFTFNMTFTQLTSYISAISLINQFIALFYAGLFGLFFFLVFRNRIIGLVFIPFWGFTEFIFFILENSGTIKLYIDYMPLKACYNLYNSHVFDLKALVVVVVISAIFIITSWLSLYKREVKSN